MHRAHGLGLGPFRLLLTRPQQGLVHSKLRVAICGTVAANTATPGQVLWVQIESAFEVKLRLWVISAPEGLSGRTRRAQHPLRAGHELQKLTKVVSRWSVALGKCWCGRE